MNTLEIVILIMEVVTCLVVLAKTPVYGVYGGLLALGASWWVWATASYRHGTSDEEATAWALLVFGLYLIVGVAVVWFKRKSEKEDAEKHVEVQSKSAAFALGEFARTSDSFKKTFQRVKALASGGMGDLSPEQAIFFDALSLIRMVALPNDEIRSADAAHLKLVSEGARYWKVTAAEKHQLRQFIEVGDTTSLPTLQMLTEGGAPARKTLRKLMSAFCKEVAAEARGARREALKETLQLIRVTAQTEQERLIASLEQEREKLEQLMVDSLVACREALGVAEGCSPAQLKAAYHAKVAQWHPDKLESMAPELRAYANEQLAKINAAYEELHEHA